MFKEKKKLLYLIDCQNDFCSEGGSLSNKESVDAVNNIVKLLKEETFDLVVCTMDTHDEDYLKTREGVNLPVKHCIRETWGHKLNRKIYEALYDYETSFDVEYIFKNTFMANEDEMRSKIRYYVDEVDVYVCGFCTDICVINNVLLLNQIAKIHKRNINLISNCCAGTTPEMHEKALEIMKINQINII